MASCKNDFLCTLTGLYVHGSGLNRNPSGMCQRLQTVKGAILHALAGTKEFVSKFRGLKF